MPAFNFVELATALEGLEPLLDTQVPDNELQGPDGTQHGQAYGGSKQDAVPEARLEVHGNPVVLREPLLGPLQPANDAGWAWRWGAWYSLVEGGAHLGGAAAPPELQQAHAQNR